MVMAILSLLVGLLLPALQASRESARRAQCQNQLRQWALAALLYHDSLGSFPGGMEQRLYSSAPIYRGSSLFVRLMAYCEQTSRIAPWNFDDPLVNTGGGRAARTAQVVVGLVCPSDVLPANPVQVQPQGWYSSLTSYGGNGGTRSYPPDQARTDGAFHSTGSGSEPAADQRPTRLRQFSDGASATLLLGERSHFDPNFESFALSGWTDRLSTWGWWAPSGGRKAIGHVTLSACAPINYRLPVDFAHRSESVPPLDITANFVPASDNRFGAFGSLHPGGCNVALVDGSVRLLSERIPLSLLAALSTRRGAEVVALPD